MLKNRRINLLIILPLFFFSSCLRLDFYAIQPLGEDHYLRMVIESTAGDSIIYQYNPSARNFKIVKTIPSALEWNIGFIPPGKKNNSFSGNVIRVFLLGKPKLQGTTLKIIPLTTLSVITQAGTHCVLLAVPADNNDRTLAVMNLEELSLVEQDIFSKTESAVVGLCNESPQGFQWFDARQTWELIENYIKL